MKLHPTNKDPFVGNPVLRNGWGTDNSVVMREAWVWRPTLQPVWRPALQGRDRRYEAEVGVTRPRSALQLEIGATSEQVWNAVKGDAGGGGFPGGEHGGGGEGAHAVFVVDLVHGGEEAGAALLFFQAVEEGEGVQAVGD